MGHNGSAEVIRNLEHAIQLVAGIKPGFKLSYNFELTNGCESHGGDQMVTRFPNGEQELTISIKILKNGNLTGIPLDL